MWLFWEGEAPAEPLGLGLHCELLPVFVRRQRGGAQRELRPPEVRLAEG